MSDRTGTCAVCGEPFLLNARGRPRKYCSSGCASSADVPVNVQCVVCGTVVQRRKRATRLVSTVCSVKCKSELKRQRNPYQPRPESSKLPADHPVRLILAGNGTCVVCGEPFPLTKTWRKYCSVKCGRKGAPSAAMVTVTCCICGESMQQRERYVGSRDPICSEACSSELKKRNLAAPRSELPADHPARWFGRSTRLRYYECADCGQIACRAIGHLSASRCRPCQVRYERKQRKRLWDRRRARKQAAYIEDVDADYIYLRDSYKCQICGKRLAMTKTVPHPKAPTIDHIIPLAQGGTHERNNVQAAHFLCNSRKSDRAAGDQLTLVG